MKKGDVGYEEFRRKANLRNKKYYSKPEVRARKKNYKKEYDLRNKEKISKYGYDLRAIPKTQERVKKWRQKNKQYLKEYSKRPDRRLAKRLSDKKHYLKNKMKDPYFLEKERIRRRQFTEAHPEAKKKYYLKYYHSPKGTLNWIRANHRRMSLKYNCKFSLKAQEIKQIFERDKVCVYCGSDKRLELDHIVSLASGGEGISDNFVVACKVCNCSKNDKEVFYWCNLTNKRVPDIVLKCLENMKSDLYIRV